MSSWRVRFTRNAEIELKKLLLSGSIPREDLKSINFWISEMEEQGPNYIRSSKDWNDHDLYYEWKGFRSSCFSYSGRIIYRVIDDEIIVEVYRVTLNHDYRR